MRTATLLIGLALVSACYCTGSAQERKTAPAQARPTSTVPKTDDSEIRAAGAAFVRAFDAGDAKAIAGQFVENGQIVSKDGKTARGRAAIEAEFSATFEEFPGAKMNLAVDSIHFLTPDAAVEEGKATLTPKGQGAVSQTGRYSVVYIRQDGKWLQAVVRDEPDDPKALTAHDHLQQIAWMVGEWVNENSDAVVSTNCDWADNKNFLIRSFTVQIAGKPAMHGSQRIGWDSLTQQIKSWVFDSEGGHGEGYWTRDGDRWIIKSTGVLPDGRAASTTDIVTYENKDSYRWESVFRVAGGEAEPDLEPIHLVRKPPKSK
jgi:uncharacterized protein (TIGR02246 family)